MKLQIAIIAAAAAAALAACGVEDPLEGSGGGESEFYELNSGSYGLSNAVLASQGDQCGLFGAYQDPSKEIGVNVQGSLVTFNLANNPSASPQSLDKSTLIGNAIGQQGETNYTVAFDDTCVVRVHRTVTGRVVNDDTAALTLDFSVEAEAGSCTADNTAFAAVPCSSTYQFTATRKR